MHCGWAYFTWQTKEISRPLICCSLDTFSSAVSEASQCLMHCIRASESLSLLVSAAFAHTAWDNCLCDVAGPSILLTRRTQRACFFSAAICASVQCASLLLPTGTRIDRDQRSERKSPPTYVPQRQQPREERLRRWQLRGRQCDFRLPKKENMLATCVFLWYLCYIYCAVSCCCVIPLMMRAV